MHQVRISPQEVGKRQILNGKHETKRASNISVFLKNNLLQDLRITPLIFHVITRGSKKLL